MRKALIVGIDHYSHIPSLSGCVNDAYAIKGVLERHADGTINFANPRLLVINNEDDILKKGDLKDAVRELFTGEADIALFYFAGHGYVEDTGGYLCTSECRRGDDGLTLAEIMTLARCSTAKNKIIILDSCHSGVAGNSQHGNGLAEISHGMAILTASSENQYAMEVAGGGAGVFTTLLVDALSGAAANLLGEITPGSVYAHIDQSLGPWGQRPVFKTNVQSFVSLRKAFPPIPLTDIQALPTLFPRADYIFPLEPSYEPERSRDQLDDPNFPAPDPEKNETFARLQRCARVNLVRPVGAPHMWHAAIQSKSCELTVLGQHYHRLVADGLI